MKINHRHLVLLIFSLASFIAASFMYFYLYNQALYRAEHSLDVSGQLKTQNANTVYEKKLESVYYATGDKRATLNAYLVDKDRIVDFIEMIEKIGKDSGVDIELSSISNDAEKVKGKIVASGEWANIMKAMISLENMPFSIVMNNIRLNQSGTIDKKVGKKIVKVTNWNLQTDIEVLTTK